MRFKILTVTLLVFAHVQDSSVAEECIVTKHPGWVNRTYYAGGVCDSVIETAPGILTCGDKGITTSNWYQLQNQLTFWRWDGTDWVGVSGYYPLSVTAAGKEDTDAIISSYPSLIPEAGWPCQDYRYAHGCGNTLPKNQDTTYKCIVAKRSGWIQFSSQGGGICNSIVETSPGILTCGDCGIVTEDWYQLSSQLTFWGWDGTTWVGIGGYYPMSVTGRAKAEIEGVMSQYPTLNPVFNNPNQDPALASGCEMPDKKENNGPPTCP